MAKKTGKAKFKRRAKKVPFKYKAECCKKNCTIAQAKACYSNHIEAWCKLYCDSVLHPN